MQEPIRTIKWQYIMYIINVNHKKVNHYVNISSIVKIKQGALTCSLALSNCLTRSSRSCAGKCRAPTSSSPSLCLVMVIRRSCDSTK